MATPESKVKAAVKKILDKYKSDVNGFWPVPYGYGESHLDYVGCCCGRFFCIETKAPGKKPTPRQAKRIADVQQAGGMAFVCDGDAELYQTLDLWLANTVRQHYARGEYKYD